MPTRSRQRTAQSEQRRDNRRSGTSGRARSPRRSWDFWSGPLAAALIGFRDFDNLLFDRRPEIRTLHHIDPVFGALVFVGVLIEPEVVEIADFEVDPDYWEMIEHDPND